MKSLTLATSMAGWLGSMARPAALPLLSWIPIPSQLQLQTGPFRCGIPGPLESPSLNCSLSSSEAPPSMKIESSRCPNGPPAPNPGLDPACPRVLLQVPCGLLVARARPTAPAGC